MHRTVYSFFISLLLLSGTLAYGEEPVEIPAEDPQATFPGSETTAPTITPADPDAPQETPPPAEGSEPSSSLLSPRPQSVAGERTTIRTGRYTSRAKETEDRIEALTRA